MDMSGMARACGRTTQITGLAFRIRIVRSPTESGTGCRLGVLQDVRRVCVRYRVIPAVDVPGLLGNRIVRVVVRATGGPERVPDSQIVRGTDSPEFFPYRIGQETGDREHLVNRIDPA